MALNLFLHTKNETPSDNLVILIHGLGASDNTWVQDGVSWVGLFSSDETLKNLDVAEVTYDTVHLANGLLALMGVKKIKLGLFKSFSVGKGPCTSIDILARELKREIDSKKIKQYKNVILIGHSMGGLVAIRYILEESENNQHHNIIGMISLSTPYNGSSFALYSQLIKSINTHAQVPSLEPNSKFLDETIRLWQKHLDRLNINFKFYFGTEDTIVPENSAIPHIISSKWTGGIPLPGDHSSILKVKDHGSTNYFHISEAVKEIFERAITIKKKMLDDQRGVPNPKGQLTIELPTVLLDKMLDIYESKIHTYIKETRDKLPFNMEAHDDKLNNSILEGFFENFTWKSKINKGLSDFSRTYNSDPYIQEKNIIPTLQKIRDLNLTYPEFKYKLTKEIQTILSDIPDTRKTSSYKVSLIEILKLLEDSYNKILLITGESGAGKTHLIYRILTNYSIEKGLEYYSIFIPLYFRENNIERTIINSLNKFFDTDYRTLLEFNQVFSNLEDCSLKIFLIIDDLQKICLTEAYFYKNLKEFIEENTVFDWINWYISINEFDQYLIIDDSNFLMDYCYYEKPTIGKLAIDLSKIFINMNDLNRKYNTFEKILQQYNINWKPQLHISYNSNNINMIINNPLMCHVYANTAKDIEIDSVNLCYFDFITRYAEIKKKRMVDTSRRSLSYIELKEAIEQDITTVAKFLIKNKKLNFTKLEYENLLEGMSEINYELRSVQLVIQNRTEIRDPFTEGGVKTKTDFLFMFKLYWAYKILLIYRENADWDNYFDLCNSFEELRNELLIYELLYLDSLKNNEDEIEKVVKNILIEANGKEVLFFVFIKMSFESQAILFNYLINGDKIKLNKSEVFGLLYFLSKTMAKSVKLPHIFVVLNKYISDISENNLGLYMESVVQMRLESLENLRQLKKCISKFISSKDDKINRGISKIAADNFYRIVSKKEVNSEQIVKQIINFLKSNSIEIEESKITTSITFTEYFLRFLFTYLIDNSSNKMQVHETLRNSDDYFMDEIGVSHILRRSVTVSYGYIYRTLKFQEKDTFKRQYLDNIYKLINSNNVLLKKLAYHFIVDTLHDYKDPDTFLEKEFIHLLKRIYDDKSLEKFNIESTERRIFIERNLSQFQL